MQRNNRMGKTRDLFKKTAETKETFHVRMGMIKDRNSKELTEKQKRLRRGDKNTQKNYTKGFHDLDNHDDVVTHLEPDILKCEVKWALGSITRNKASGGDRISAALFKILKDDVMVRQF